MSTTKKEHLNHCYDGCETLCHNDSCYYNPRNFPSEECGYTVPWEVTFIWNFTKQRGCCSFEDESNCNVPDIIQKIKTEIANEYLTNESNRRIARIVLLVEELETKLDMVDG